MGRVKQYFEQICEDPEEKDPEEEEQSGSDLPEWIPGGMLAQIPESTLYEEYLEQCCLPGARPYGCRKYFGIKTWTYNGKTYTNGNRLLGSYAGCDGMKTGFTNKSKYSLVATAQRGGKRMMSVVLGAENKDVRANVSIQMLNKGFALSGVASDASTVPASPAPVAQPKSNTTAAPTFNAAYVAATSGAQNNSAPAKSTHASGSVATATGGAGVQFGAFSSRDAAVNQVANVKSSLNVTPVIEKAPNGMWRVRVNGLSDAAAAALRQRASGAGIDSYVFH